MKKKQIYLFLPAVLMLFIFFIGYAKYVSIFPSTDDAYLQANTVNIAPQISGPVKTVYVHDHQFVLQGQLLFIIDPAPFDIAVKKAEAALNEAKAALNTQQKNTVRILQLVKLKQAALSAGDDAQGQYYQLFAAEKLAESNLAEAQLHLSYTRITAPSAGYVTNFVLRPGQWIQAGDYLFALIEKNQWWIDANFKETELARIKNGQPVQIKLDMYPKNILKGIVAGISAGSGAAFAILPPQNAAGNWVKITQRFPIRINILNPDPRYPLRIGASGEVTIDTRHQ